MVGGWPYQNQKENYSYSDRVSNPRSAKDYEKWVKGSYWKEHRGYMEQKGNDNRHYKWSPNQLFYEGYLTYILSIQ